MSTKFKEGFKVLLKEPSDDVIAEKCWTKIDSAFVSKLAILNSDKFEEQIKVDELKEKLNKAKFNNGEEVTKREAYLNKLINLKNELTIAENNLTELTATIDFLTEVYEELK